MPRKLDATMTFDSLEDEVLFTAAALVADEDAADLAPQGDAMLSLVDTARSADRTVRQAAARTDAVRIVSNAKLDRAVVSFGDDLYLAVGKDRQSSRWTQYFSKPVNLFIKQPLADEVSRVQGWLAASSSSDSVLEAHREDLTKRSSAAATALVDTQGLSVVRGQNWQRREKLALDLTNARDTLHAQLAARARERGMPRDWPDQFFRVERVKDDKPVPAGTAVDSTTASPATGAPPVDAEASG